MSHDHQSHSQAAWNDLEKGALLRPILELACSATSSFQSLQQNDAKQRGVISLWRSVSIPQTILSPSMKLL
jgi:hypothetical protein